MIILPKNSLTPRGSCFRAFHFPVSLQEKQKKRGGGGGWWRDKKKGLMCFLQGLIFLMWRRAGEKKQICFSRNWECFWAGKQEEAEIRLDHIRWSEIFIRRMPISQVSAALSLEPGEVSTALWSLWTSNNSVAHSEAILKLAPGVSVKLSSELP